MSSKEAVLTDGQIGQLYLISDLSSRAHKNNLRLSQGPEASDYREKAQSYKRAKVKLEGVTDDLRRLNEEKAQVEKELATYEEQLVISKGRLDHVGGSDFRGLTIPALKVEIASLEAKVSEFTDAEIELLEEVEELDKQKDGLESQLKEDLSLALVAKEALEALRKDVAAIDEQLQSELLAVRSEIAAEVAAVLDRVPVQIIDKVAHVTDACCSGCRLRISSILAERIKRRPEEIHYCEECGRLLLPVAG